MQTMKTQNDTYNYPKEVISVLSERLIKCRQFDNRDTTVMYQANDNDTIYETPTDGANTKIWKARTNLFNKAKIKISLNTIEMSEEEFRSYLDDKNLLDCTTKITGSNCK